MNDPIDWSEDPRLVAYALGELDDADRAAIERALAADPDCRAALDEITAFLPELERAVRAGEPEAGLESGAHASIVAAARRNVSVGHFALHAEPLPLEKGLHRGVEICFTRFAHRPAGRVRD